MILLGFMKLMISATLVIRKWFHAISKYNEPITGSFYFSEITFKMQITDYLASANSPIHTSHFDPHSL
jgi:hypothetical protein